MLPLRRPQRARSVLLLLHPVQRLVSYDAHVQLLQQHGAAKCSNRTDGWEQAVGSGGGRRRRWVRACSWRPLSRFQETLSRSAIQTKAPTSRSSTCVAWMAQMPAAVTAVTAQKKTVGLVAIAAAAACSERE